MLVPGHTPADRAWTAALAAGVAIGLGLLQVDWWARRPAIDLLATEPDLVVRFGADVEIGPGRAAIDGRPASCDPDRICPDAAVIWRVPLDTPFAEIAASGRGDAVGGPWVRAEGLHGATALADPLPQSRRKIVPVGRAPLDVRVRYRDATGALEVDRLTVTPLDERKRAKVARAATWAGWLLLGWRTARALAAEVVDRRRALLLGAAILALWLPLSGPSLEWIELRTAGPAAVEPLRAPDVPYPRRPPPSEPTRKRDLLPISPFTAFHAVGFFAVGSLFVWGRARSFAPVVALAPASELVQGILPGRTARVDDVLTDLLGLSAGVGAALAIRYARRREDA